MTDTPLGEALQALHEAPEDESARLRFYARLADGELVLLLAREVDGAQLEPELFDLEAGRFVLAFDSEAALAEFSGGVAAYAAVPGRVLAQMLAGQGVGLGVNLGRPGAQLLPPEVMDWFAQTLQSAPREITARPSEVHAPHDVPEALVTALDGALARAEGLAACACLVGVTDERGVRRTLLAFIDAREGAQAALTRAASEALTFSGAEADALDVGFLASDGELARRLSRVALRFEMTAPPAPDGPVREEPPQPPRLR